MTSTDIDAVSILILDGRGNIVAHNDATEKLFGYTGQELANQLASKLILDATSIQSTPERTIQSKFVGQRKDGAVIPIEFYVSELPAPATGLRVALIKNLSEKTVDANSLALIDQRFQAQYKAIPIPTYTWQKSGDDFSLIDYNDAAVHYTKGIITQFIGIKASQMYRDEPDIIECFHKCFENKTSVTWEGLYHFKVANVFRYVTTTFGYVPPDLIMVHVEDITERKNAEEALRDSETKLRAIAENSPDHIMLLDPKGKILFINHTVPDLTVEQVIGTSVYKYVPDSQRGIMQECYERVAKIGEPDQFEIYYEGKFGIAFFENRVGPITSNGQIVALTVSSRDITKRKQAEADVRRLNNQLGLLLESTEEGIFGVDHNMHCTFINRAAAEMLGYTPEDIEGRDMHSLVHFAKEDGTPYLKEECPIYRTMMQNSSVWSDNEVLWRKDGTFIPTQYSANPITSENNVTGAVVVFRNIAESRAMARKMDYLATHDVLTGLVNRHEFEQRLEHALNNAQKENGTHILCYLDLDQFKVVNDTCGHVAGDELLRQLAALLHNPIRQNDTLARLGGDEFGVLLANCGLDKATNIVDGIRRTVQDFRFVWEDKTFTIGVSIGVVEVTGETDSIGSALSAADAACYVAKDSGRNRVHVYQADDAELTQRHGEMQWVSRIHNAFELERFQLRFQIIEPLAKTQQTTAHIEILTHILDDQGAIIPPGAFIPAAERYNLMPTIDRWVVRSTLNWLKNLGSNIGGLELCTINLSGHSICEEAFLKFIVNHIKQTGVPANKLGFEITETAAVANLSRAVQFIKELKKLGCRFALDDFGSGMSSFAYLKNLPVDYLKIDGNFVRDIVDDPVDHAMVEAINQVGHVMGIKTIAEFVENDAILHRLHEIGVDFAQGYCIAKPKPISELQKIL